MNIKTVLITGGCGFIGSHFVKHFLKKRSGLTVVNLDALTYAGNPENLAQAARHRNYKFVKADITDPKAVDAAFKKYQPAWVVNFAAESHVDRSIHGGARDFVATNAAGVLSMLEAAKKYGVKKFVQISTDEVYGSLPLRGGKKFTEATPLNPRSPYSASKAAGDVIALSYFTTYGLPVVVTRSSNNYGTHQHPEKFIPNMILKAAAGASLPVYGDGLNVRDWLHVQDNVEAIEKVLFKGRPGQAYNIGGDCEMANIDVAKTILAALKKPVSLIKYVPDRPGHDRRYALSFAKLGKELNWRPKRNFEKHLKETVQWYCGNEKWVSNALKRNR